jgi:hypothetical protein
MTDENKKTDLVWIIPEILGSLAISVSGAVQLGRLSPILEIGFWNWIFWVALCGVVVMAGIKGFSHGAEELKQIKWK